MYGSNVLINSRREERLDSSLQTPYQTTRPRKDLAKDYLPINILSASTFCNTVIKIRGGVFPPEGGRSLRTLQQHD